MERLKPDKIPRPLTDLPSDAKPVIRQTRERVRKLRTATKYGRSVEFDNAVLMNMGEGMYTVDKKGAVTSMNQTAEILFGWTFDELAGRKMHDATHYMHRDGSPFPAEECAGFRVLTSGETLKDHDDTFIRKDGTFFDVVYSSSPLRDKDEIVGLVVVFRDVTERNKTFAALRESEERFGQFMNFLPGLAWIKDLEGRYVFVNDAAERAFRRSRNELYGHTDIEIFPPETAARFFENDRLAINSGTGIRSTETLADENGVLRHSFVSKFPIFDADGAVTLIGGVAIDITERMKAEARLNFLGNISEIIRTAENTGDLLYRISESVGEHLQVRRCLFNEIDLENDRESVHRDYCRGAGSVAGVHKISDYSSITSAEAQKGNTVVNCDSKTDQRTAGDYERAYAPNGERSYVVVPLMREDKWVASLWVSDDVPRNWTSDDVSLLEIVAERTWTTVEKLRTNAELRQQLTLIELSYEPILIWDVDNIITSWNKGCEELYGYTRAEAIGKKSHVLLKTVHPISIDELWKCLEKDGIWSGELRQMTKDGRQVVVESRHQLTNSTGVSLVLETNRDITDRIVAGERSARLAAIVESSADAIVSKDLNGIVASWNRAAEDLFGYTASEIIGRPITTLIPDDRLDEEPAILNKIRKGEKVDHYETVRRCKDGHLVDVSISVSPIIGSMGRVIGASKIARDITERKATEERLRESEARFALAQEAGNVGVWDWDLITNRTYWSVTMWRLYGVERQDVNPDEGFWLSHIHEDDRERARLNINETLSSKDVRHSDIFRVPRKGGGVRWIESTATIQRDVDGKPFRMYGVDQDITERKNHESNLQQAYDELEFRIAERTKELANSNSRLVRQMRERAFAEKRSIGLLRRLLTIQEDKRGRIARAIHDQMGQRLTELRLKIASLKDLCLDDPEKSQRIDRLQAIAEHIDSEVSFIAWELRPAVLDDVEFVKALGDYVSEWSRHSDIFAEFNAIGLKGVKLGVDIENNLYRITQEALNNAAKHAQANRINVLLEKRNEEILLIIEDNGKGFNPSLIKTDAESGSGFGLSGMRERASLISGTFEIESSRKNGTSIFVSVPIS